MTGLLALPRALRKYRPTTTWPWGRVGPCGASWHPTFLAEGQCEPAILELQADAF